MAKQKNIKIVYQVDTTQVTAAAATVAKAKTATDQLKNSTKQLGDTAKQTGTQYKLTLQDLIGEMNLLRQKIAETATSDKARLDQLIPKYREVKAQVQQLNLAIDGTAKSAAAASVSLGNIYNSVRLALTAGLIRETANAVIEMTNLAGKIEGVKKAFDKLPNSILLMEELKQRTHGALTELELMQKALQARNFGIPVEQLGKLLEFAAIKSQQTGISIQYLTDSIVTGLGRESIKILDNLQIDIGKLKARMEETGLSMREVVGDIVNEELKKMGGYLETGATKVTRLETAFKELGSTASKEFAEGGWADFFRLGFEGLDDFIQGRQSGLGSSVIRALKDAREEAAKNVQLIKDSKKDIAEEIALNQKSLTERIARVAALKAENVELTEKNKSFIGLQKFNTEEAKRIEFNENVIEALEHKIQVDGIESTLLKELAKNQEIANELQDEGTVTIDTLNKKVDEYNEKIQNTNIHDQTRLKQLENLRDQVIAYRDALENLNKPMPDAESEPTFELTGELAQKNRDIGKELADDTKRTWDEINRKTDQGMQDAHDLDVADLERKEKWARDREKIIRGITNIAINSARDVLTAWNQSQADQEDNTMKRLEMERSALDEHYDGILSRTGDNTRARQRMEIEYEQKKKELEAKRETEQIAADAREAAREKKERLRQVAIDTAAGIVRALTIAPGIGRGGLIAAGFLTAEGIAQAAIINKFRHGVIDLQGEGTETSDSIPAMLSKRESVMTAAETKGSLGILKNIRARKLDDRIFEKLVVNGPAQQATDFSPVIKAIEKNRPSDLVRQGSFIYETKEIQKGLKKKIRRASFG